MRIERPDHIHITVTLEPGDAYSCLGDLYNAVLSAGLDLNQMYQQYEDFASGNTVLRGRQFRVVSSGAACCQP